MLIKFKDHDPRAGTVARMDSGRGQQLVDAGAAVRVSENGTPIDAEPAVTPSTSTSRKPTAPRPARNPPKPKVPAQLKPVETGGATDPAALPADPDAGKTGGDGLEAQPLRDAPAAEPSSDTVASGGLAGTSDA